MSIQSSDRHLPRWTLPSLPHGRIFENRPPWPSNYRPPQVVDLKTFEEVHRWADIRMKEYIEFPRCNYTAVCGSMHVAATLRQDCSLFMYANNAFSRIEFARIVSSHVSGHNGMKEGPLFFVTFVLDVDAFPMSTRRHGRGVEAAFRGASQAAGFSIHIIQQRVRQALQGIPFMGMVELALFKRWGPSGKSYVDWVSWHAHVFVWGVPKRRIEAGVAPMREKHRSVLRWLGPVHIRELTSDNLEDEVLYPFKAPQKTTEVNWLKAWLNPKTGEVQPAGWHAQKDWLRTGDRVRLLDIMGRRVLDKLLFGGGTGMDLVYAIREEALQPLKQLRRSYLV